MSQEAKARTRRILVVDDDYYVSDMLVEALQEWGYAADVAPNVHGLNRHLELHPPDLIILDINLPGMDGTEIGHVLHRNPATVAIPVLLLSADRRLEQKATRMQVSGWMSKPVDLDMLGQKIATLLDGV